MSNQFKSPDSSSKPKNVTGTINTITLIRFQVCELKTFSFNKKNNNSINGSNKENISTKTSTGNIKSNNEVLLNKTICQVTIDDQKKSFESLMVDLPNQTKNRFRIIIYK